MTLAFGGMIIRSVSRPRALAIATLLLAGCATDRQTPAEPETVLAGRAFMTETCEYIQHLLDIDQQALEQSRGSVISIDAPTAEGASAGVTYASKLQVPGWKDCAIFSYDETASDDDPYVDHTLHCFFLELESERAARSYVKSVYRCTKDVFSERSFSEAWQAGGYDMIGFEGEVTPAGKGVPVYFGSTTYARLSVDSLDEEVSVVVNYQFLKTPVPDGAEGKGERIILR